jgi:hypothetical protein
MSKQAKGKTTVWVNRLEELSEGWAARELVVSRNKQHFVEVQMGPVTFLVGDDVAAKFAEMLNRLGTQVALERCAAGHPCEECKGQEGQEGH